MKYFFLIITVILFSCKPTVQKIAILEKATFNKELTLSFGSCNNQRNTNTLYDDILKNKPVAWIWGGDIIYSDTDNPTVLKENFDKYKKDSAYTTFRNKTTIIATWDDHDYGLNDGGTENPIKKEAQQLFLDFLDVPANADRRKHAGVYYSTTIEKGSNSVKIIVLDTRYFRTALTPDPSGKKRYIPNTDSTSTLLGATQWNWLEKELTNSKADFNIIVSSIQFLSDRHGFESWGNIPLEVQKLKELIISSKAKNTIILSGDRHIAEISKTNIGKFTYPLIDITSSGLTHSYTSFHGEENPYRISTVIFEKNFGLLHFDFSNNKVLFEIRGENNRLLGNFIQQY